ncbi:hypothetical protein [Lentzea sp. NPDC051838]|uniref:hypothetical protein n=1 Tax=Lentzea sp. NPDC051838 TaxID=3154849 RepID=UPI00341E4858
MAIEQVPSAEWPTSENRPLLVMLFSPEELAEKFGLVFDDDEDDLGPLKLAVVRASFGVAGLIRYVDAPFDGTTVYVDRDADLESTHRAVVSELGLESSDISWAAE